MSSHLVASTSFEILDAEPHHMPAVQAIYSHYVLHDLCSFEEEVPTVQQMQARRADVLARGLPYLVAMKDGEVAGYAYASPYRARSAYRHTVEDSIYVAHGMHGLGGRHVPVGHHERQHAGIGGDHHGLQQPARAQQREPSARGGRFSAAHVA